MKLGYFLLLVFSVDSLEQYNPCDEFETCDSCIQASIDGGCNWCYQRNYTGVRCFHTAFNHNCNPDSIHPHLEKSYANELLNDMDFMDVINPDNENEAVQIKPQRIKIKVIPKTPTTFTFKYRLAKDYPLDLYYLTDLTLTMEPDISTLSSLGSDLTNVLQNLTKYYKVAYGYYSDKVAIPFSKLTPAYLENPCVSLKHTCQKAFAFVHALNFTDNINEFIEKVNASRTTANIDNLEGGMEALLQVVLCQKHIKWRTNTRKIVVIATDGTMHLAGDGKLAGVIKKNAGECALDNRGLYTKSLLFDYPSLEQIHRQLIKHKITVLFAVKQSVYNYYSKLNRQIPELTYVGKLQEKSANVLDLVKEGYMKVIRTAKFTWNHIEGLNVTFHSTCNKQTIFYPTDTCEDVNLGEEYTFNVDVEINHLPNEKSDMLIIEEQDIAEKLVVEIEYLGKCNCNYPWTDSNEKYELCNKHGEFICGKCQCENEWKGETCEKSCTEESINECREINSTYTSSTCYLHGDCNCGKCDCDYHFMGPYCQYNQCPRNRYGEICSGNANGECIKGKCHCFPHTTGEDCSCILSEKNCIAPGASTVCNDVGKCVCGKCECPSPYTGKYCEFCPECTGLCSNYDKCVLDMVRQETDKNICFGNDSWIYEATFLSAEPEGENKCFNRYQQGEDTFCDLYYVYNIKKGAVVELKIFKNCKQPIQASVLIGLIVGSILAGGLFILMMYKAKIWREERLEYRRFELEIKTSRRGIGENPLYRSPIKTYIVPTTSFEES